MRFKLGIALVVGFLEVPLSRLAEHRIVESWIIIAAAISFLAGAAIAFGLRATSDALLIAFAVAAGEILYFACLQVVSGPTPGRYPDRARSSTVSMARYGLTAAAP